MHWPQNGNAMARIVNATAVKGNVMASKGIANISAAVTNGKTKATTVKPRRPDVQYEAKFVTF